MKGYYVGNTDLSLLGSLSLHDMEIEVRDEKGREVVIGRGAGSWLWKPNTPLAEKLERAYVHLQPGMIHGLKEQIHLPLKPGRYRLVTTYREYYASILTEEARKALPVQIWTQPLVSNTVTVTVIP